MKYKKISVESVTITVAAAETRRTSVSFVTTVARAAIVTFFVNETDCDFFIGVVAMIEEILSKVRSAEQQAEEIKASAEQSSDAERAKSDALAAEQVANAKAEAKNYKEAQLTAAERESETYKKQFDLETQAECESLKKKYANKAALLSEEVYRRVTDGNF